MLRIKCFAIIKELTGKEDIEVELSVLEDNTIASLWRHLEKTYPQLEGKQKYIRFAKNMSFVSIDATLVDGDEIGIIPPVSGG